MENPLITAVTHSRGEARVTLWASPTRPASPGRVTTALAEANVNIDMIIQNEPRSEGALAELSFTVPQDDAEAAPETRWSRSRPSSASGSRPTTRWARSRSSARA